MIYIQTFVSVFLTIHTVVVVCQTTSQPNSGQASDFLDIDTMQAAFAVSSSDSMETLRHSAILSKENGPQQFIIQGNLKLHKNPFRLMVRVETDNTDTSLRTTYYSRYHVCSSSAKTTSDDYVWPSTWSVKLFDAVSLNSLMELPTKGDSSASPPCIESATVSTSNKIDLYLKFGGNANGNTNEQNFTITVRVTEQNQRPDCPPGVTTCVDDGSGNTNYIIFITVAFVGVIVLGLLIVGVRTFIVYKKRMQQVEAPVELESRQVREQIRRILSHQLSNGLVSSQHDELSRQGSQQKAPSEPDVATTSNDNQTDSGLETRSPSVLMIRPHFDDNDGYESEKSEEKSSDSKQQQKDEEKKVDDTKL